MGYAIRTIAFALLSIHLALPAHARLICPAHGPGLDVGAAVGLQGEQVTLPITMHDTADAGVVGGTLLYRSNYLTLLGCTPGPSTLARGGTCECAEARAGRVKWAAYTMDLAHFLEPRPNGVVCNVTFQIRGCPLRGYFRIRNSPEAATASAPAAPIEVCGVDGKVYCGLCNEVP